MKIIKMILGVVGIIIVFFLLRTVIFPNLDRVLINLFQKQVTSGSEYETKQDCEKNKGDWGRAGIYPHEFCRIPLSDFGKPCIAGFMCQAGTCIAPYTFRENPIMTSGLCPKYTTIFGCTQEVHFGFTHKPVCRD